MKTIKFNNNVIPVPSDTIIEYLEYRKITKNLETAYSDGLIQAQDNLIKNIMTWANDYAGLNTTFTKLAPLLEKIAIELI